MRFSFWIGSGHGWPEIRRSGLRAEAEGFDGLWFADHFVPSAGPEEGPCHEVWSVLAALGDATEAVRLGPLVCGNTYRNPGVLAKQAVTTDHICGGRLVLGIGAGWLESEHRAYGLEYGTFTDRFARLEESLQIIRSLRDHDLTTFEGEHYHLDRAPLAPKPVGPLPILLGGGGERKTLRLVARYAEEWNVWATPEIMAHKLAVLDGHCEAVQRDPASIQRSAVALVVLTDSAAEADEARARFAARGRPALVGDASSLADQLAAFAEMGVDEFIVPDFTLGEPEAKDAFLARFMAEVVAPLRS
jgi:F420-dependent oxidoreductase-like protein